jgi:hypothetical protein
MHGFYLILVGEKRGILYINLQKRNTNSLIIALQKKLDAGKVVR